MNICGVDVSTRAIDLVFLSLDTDHARWEHIPIADKRGSFYAARNVHQAITDAGLIGTAWDDTAALYLEDPMSRNMGTCKALALVTGALIACVPGWIIVERTKPNEWQRVFTGKAKANKYDITGRACEIIGTRQLWTQDAYDAFGIAWAMRDLSERAAKTTAA